MPNQLAFRVPLLAKRDWRVASVELGEECRAGQPHPVPDVAGLFIYWLISSAF